MEVEDTPKLYDHQDYSSLASKLQECLDVENIQNGQILPQSLERMPLILEIISAHTQTLNLEPEGVLNILLDLYLKELHVNYSFLVDLFKHAPLVNSNQQSLIIARLLGYKLAHKTKDSSAALYYGCAILIKQGLVHLDDQLRYLKPAQAEMEAAANNYIKNMKNSIANMEKLIKSPELTGEGQHANYPANDVVELAKALLAVGDIVHAMLIFTKCEMLVEMYPEVTQYVLRLCQAVLKPISSCYKPVSEKKKRVRFEDVPESTFPQEMKRVQVTDCLLEKIDDQEKQERYTFFYSEWNEGLPQCKTYEDLTNVFAPVMRLAGSKVNLETSLLQKLLQTVHNILIKEVESPEAKSHCLAIIREFLLPALSFSNIDEDTLGSLSGLFELLPYHDRFDLYEEWDTSFYEKDLETKLLESRVRTETKRIVRLAIINSVTMTGRSLAKLSKSNPIITLNVMLDHIQTMGHMSNIPSYMANACRYMGELSYDVLSYLLTKRCTSHHEPGEPQKMEENATFSSWFQALVTFIIMFYRTQVVDPAPLINSLSRSSQDRVCMSLVRELFEALYGVTPIGHQLPTSVSQLRHSLHRKSQLRHIKRLIAQFSEKTVSALPMKEIDSNLIQQGAIDKSPRPINSRNRTHEGQNSQTPIVNAGQRDQEHHRHDRRKQHRQIKSSEHTVHHDRYHDHNQQASRKRSLEEQAAESVVNKRMRHICNSNHHCENYEYTSALPSSHHKY